MADDAEPELPERLRDAALVEAEYQKTETERKIKLAEAAEHDAAGESADANESDEKERSEQVAEADDANT